MRLPQRCFWAVAGFVAAGCSAHATQGQLRAAAAADLNCPGDNLRFRQLDEAKHWVAGCGKSATYKEDCRRGGGGESCRWKKLPDEISE